MQAVIRIAISIAIILIATGIARKFPSLAGLIAVMPLTGALVLVWVYSDNKSNPNIIQDFTKGAIYGIIPSIFFFLVAFLCFKKELPLPIVLGSSFAVWIAAAFAHQWLLK